LVTFARRKLAELRPGLRAAHAATGVTAAHPPRALIGRRGAAVIRRLAAGDPRERVAAKRAGRFGRLG
jgi:hypothetical protein